MNPKCFKDCEENILPLQYLLVTLFSISGSQCQENVKVSDKNIELYVRGLISQLSVSLMCGDGTQVKGCLGVSYYYGTKLLARCYMAYTTHKIPAVIEKVNSNKLIT